MNLSHSRQLFNMHVMAAYAKRTRGRPRRTWIDDVIQWMMKLRDYLNTGTLGERWHTNLLTQMMMMMIIIIIINVIYRAWIRMYTANAPRRHRLLRALQFTSLEMFSAVSAIQTVTYPDEVQLAGCSTRQDRWQQNCGHRSLSSYVEQALGQTQRNADHHHHHHHHHHLFANVKHRQQQVQNCNSGRTTRQRAALTVALNME